MGAKPLHLPWDELLCDRERSAPDVEIVSGRRGGERQALAAEPSSLVTMTDHALAEKIERHQKHIASGVVSKLPDRGGKLMAKLKSLEEELERRRSLVRSINDKADEECKEIERSPRRRSSESFGSHFSKLLDEKADRGNCDAHREELRIMCKDVSNNLTGLDWKRNSLRGSSTSSRFQTPKIVNRKDGHKSHNKHPKAIVISSVSSPEQVERHTNYHYKRRKSPDNQSSVELNPTEVQDVVFLDEDAQRVEQQLKGDKNEDGLQLSNETKFYYPSRDHPECVELCHSDLKCLEPESYLSSTIMNFYILYLQSTISSSGRSSREYHFCNTYFYRKLEEATSQKGEISKHLTKLRRWWKGVNIFEKAYIFLPIHGDLHWSLAIICIPAKQDEFGPIILHLDSLRFHPSGLIFHNVERYLKEEWAYLEETACPVDLPISERVWKNLPRRIEKKKIAVPQQKNDYDCGLFVLYFMERFIEAAPARLRREDLAMFGKKWFDPEEASGLRQRLRDLLERLFQIPSAESD